MANDIRQTGHNSYLYTHMLVSVVYGEIVKLLIDINCPIETILDDPLEDYRKILIRTTLDDMLQELYRFVARICDFLDKNINANQSVAERAKAYIEAHYADSGLTLDQVASEMGISPNYFSAQFKQNTGSSFINYLTNVRISHAKAETTKPMRLPCAAAMKIPPIFPRSSNEEQGFHPQSIVMTEKEAVD